MARVCEDAPWGGTSLGPRDGSRKLPDEGDPHLGVTRQRATVALARGSLDPMLGT